MLVKYRILFSGKTVLKQQWGNMYAGAISFGQGKLALAGMQITEFYEKRILQKWQGVTYIQEFALLTNLEAGPQFANIQFQVRGKNCACGVLSEPSITLQQRQWNILFGSLNFGYLRDVSVSFSSISSFRSQTFPET